MRTIADTKTRHYCKSIPLEQRVADPFQKEYDYHGMLLLCIIGLSHARNKKGTPIT